MNIIKIKKEDLKNISCYYGIENNNVTDIIINYINERLNNNKLNNNKLNNNKLNNNKLNNNKLFIKLNVNNKTMGEDPIPGKVKFFYININNFNYKIKEGSDIFFDILKSFDIIYKDDINDIDIKNYDNATIFGKGPTFKIVDKKENELRCAINQAANVAPSVDFLCMNDHHNLFIIDDKTYNNLKYLLIPEYLHINRRFSQEGYFVNILDYLNGRFFGKLIVYNLITSKIKTPYIIDLNTAITSGNNIFEFICRYTDIKNVNIYGMGIKGKTNYNERFVGNGKYDDTRAIVINNSLKDIANQYNVKYKLN
jgi:hypothetical protein